jgi:hypothetical protein
MADIKVAYASSAAITCSLASLATSATLVAGRASAEVDNTSALHLDKWLSGQVMVGTTPTVNTVIEVWLIPKREDGSYHDAQGGAGFDGTDKAVTVTSRDHLLSYGTLIASMTVPATTSNVAYEFARSAAAALGGALPHKFQLFVTHNTGVNLNSTGGNHLLYQKGVYSTAA